MTIAISVKHAKKRYLTVPLVAIQKNCFFSRWLVVTNQKIDELLESGEAARNALALPDEISINESEEILKNFYKEYKKNK